VKIRPLLKKNREMGRGGEGSHGVYAGVAWSNIIKRRNLVFLPFSLEEKEGEAPEGLQRTLIDSLLNQNLRFQKITLRTEFFFL